MLVLRPIGRGNWTPTYLVVSGRTSPLLFNVGDRLPFGGAVFRIVRIHA